jgi:hypothetical protein
MSDERAVAELGTSFEGGGEKPWWQSRTILGILIMLLAQALKYLQVDLATEELTQIVYLAAETLGASLAIWGRVQARKQIKRTKPGGSFNPNAEVRKAKRS